MFAGFWLFVTICALALAPYAFPQVGAWPVIVLLAIWLLTVPTSKKASAGRSSGEAVSPTGERGD